MVRLIIWIIWLVCLLCLCVALSRRVLLTPQFGFIACFIPQAVFLLFFIEKWDVDLSDETLLALIGSVTIFFVVSMFCVWFYMRVHDINQMCRRRVTVVAEPIHLSNTVLAMLFVLNVIEIILWLYYVSKLTPGGTFIEKFAYIASVSKFGDFEDKVRFPFFLGQLKIFFDASGYMMVYLFVHSIILKYKGNRILLLLNIACWFTNMFFSGNRGPFVIIFFMAIVQGYFIYGKSKGWSFHIRFKALFCILGLGVLILCALYWTLSWFGRNFNQSMVDYLGMYLAAPLKNFDTFVREGKFGNELVHSETFRILINSFGHIFGKAEWQLNYEIPFRSINGYNLGNVYTVFYCYLHDFDYAGLYGLTALMAVISQITYLKVIYGNKQKKISILLLVYSYMYQGLLLSFFSDRFYTSLFSTSTLKYLMSWWLLRWIFTRVKPGRNKINSCCAIDTWERMPVNGYDNRESDA